MENSICEHCISGTLEYTDDEVTCTSCGIFKIVNVTHLNEDYCEQKEKQLPLEKIAEEFIKTVSIFDLTSVETGYAFEIFKNNFKEPIIRKKYRMIAYCCCIFIASTGKLQIKDILNYLNCSWKEFNQIYNKIEERPTIQLIDHKDQVTSILNNIDFGEQKDKIIDISSKLLEIAEKSWLVTGKSTESMVHTVCYYAWKALNRKAQNLSFSHFRSILPVKNVYKNNKQFENLLITLGNYLPWIKNNKVTKKNLHIHIPDIVKHSDFLKDQLIQKEVPSGNKVETSQAIYKKFRGKYIKQKSNKEPTEEKLDEDFSDSEIDQYIKTPEEINILMAKR